MRFGRHCLRLRRRRDDSGHDADSGDAAQHSSTQGRSWKRRPRRRRARLFSSIRDDRSETRAATDGRLSTTATAQRSAKGSASGERLAAMAGGPDAAAPPDSRPATAPSIHIGAYTHTLQHSSIAKRSAAQRGGLRGAASQPVRKEQRRGLRGEISPAGGCLLPVGRGENSAPPDGG